MNLKNFPKRLDSKTSCLRISVPENLDLALEGLIRKVLREQPKTDDIYSFAADYFETLLEIRDKTGAKFTATQLCPFHNDEDAHEMIKLAGTFPKPASKGKPETTKTVKPKKVEENSQGKKDVRRSKAKESSKGKIPVEKNKQATPDLIKKLPTLIKSESKSTEEDKNNEGEFLTSDPIKELVDKELMESARKQKTDGKDKTEGGNTKEKKKREGKAGEETKLETRGENEKKQPNNEGNEMTKAKAEENEEITTETGKIKEGGEEDEREENEKITEDLKSRNEENKKDREEEKEEKFEASAGMVESKENAKKIHTEDAEARRTEESTKLEQAEGQPEIKKEGHKLEKENDSNKMDETEINKKEEEKPEKNTDSNRPDSETESAKQGSDVHTDKLSQILGEAMRKDKDELIQDTSDIPEKPKEPSRVINIEPVMETTTATPKPSETEITKASEDQLQTNTTKTDLEITPQVRKSVKEEEIPSPITEPDVEKEAVNTGDVPKDDKGKPEEAQAVNTTTEEPETKQESANEDLKSILTESENKKNTDAQKPAEQLAELSHQQTENVGNSEEPEAEQKELHKNEKPLSLVEEPIERTTGKEDNKPQETEKPDNETAKEAKADEKTTERKSEPEDAANEAKDKPEEKPVASKSGSEKPEDEAENETETPNCQLDLDVAAKLREDKENLEKEKKLANKEETIETGEEKPKSQILQTENVSTNSETPQQKAETEIQRNQSSGLNHPPAQEEIPTEVQEPTKEENRAVVSILHLPNSNETTTDEKLQTEEIEPELEGPKEEKATLEKLCEVTDIQKIPKMEETVDEKSKTENTPKEVKVEREAKGDAQKQEVEPESEELCTVVDIQHLPKKEETADKKPEAENTEEEVGTKRETGRSTQKEEVETKTEEEAKAENQAKENIRKKEMKKEQEAEENTRTHEPKPEAEELCGVVDVQHLPKQEETVVDQPDEKPESENKQKEVEAENPSTTVSKQEEQDERKTDETLKSQGKTVKAEPPLANSPQLPEDKTGESRPAEEKPEKREAEFDSIATATPEHVITVEEAKNLVENPEVLSPPTEIQIKKIQTHYYDSLQVPETVTKEYRVHSVETPTVASLLGVDDILQRGYEAARGLARAKAQNPAALGKDMNSPEKFLEGLNASNASRPLETKPDAEPDIPESSDAKTESPTTALNEQDLLKSESDDLLTPTSGYSLNLSELSYQTVHGLFLDSERRHSSFEKEETRYATPKSSATASSEKNTENRQEVEEVIEKTIIPSSIGAVPMAPRETEEITEENETTENVKEKKEEKQDEKPKKQPSEESDSTNGRSEDSDAPFVSVEVKTVVETQVLDDEDEDEEKDAERPNLEVKVEARIDVQDDSRNSQSNVETETEIAKEKSDEKLDLKLNSPFQSRNEDGNKKVSCSTEAITGKDGSTGESDSVSSAATEIKRTGSGKRDLSSIRGLSSTQSLDFGKRNPLVKTRSLSTFRHGVTDFEVWNAIEKELEDAATKIQSKFRGYKTRKKLQRENAVQITTEETSSSTTPGEGDPKEEYQQSTGEFHDTIVLSEHPR